MRTHSALEICLPLALFVAACALSLPTLVIAFLWMTIGVVSVGHRTLDSFPTDGMPRKWLKGYRGACLWFYHLAWWPWYMRASIRDIGGQIGATLCRAKKSQDKGPDSPSDHQSNGDGE
jgi:hypothetical protein